MSDVTEEQEITTEDIDYREARWPASMAVVAALVLYVTLPEKLTFGPNWLVPALELVLLLPLALAVPHRRRDELRWHRITAIGLIGIINLANVLSLDLLVEALLKGTKATGTQLIIEAAKIWLTNVLVFALWYWELDGGGPGERIGSEHCWPDFLFPQLATPNIAPPRWRPRFLDYLYVAFTNATAFSPTDTLPLSAWAKVLMLLQSMASLLTVVLVASRAVNILS